jgi:putative peptidoglycan lipid II flippase
VSEPPELGWSEPSLYRGGAQVFVPRMFTEADPMASQVLLLDWDEPDARHEPQWGAPTYVGPRRLRPGTKPAGEAIGEARATEAGVPETAAVAERQRASRGLIADSRTMAVASLASRVTGFLRSSMLVAAIGIHGVGDAYNVANNFPNMVYELLLGGVLSSVLIPLLVHAQEEDPDGGEAYTQRLLSVATAALGVMTLLAVACAPLLAAGFVSDPSQRSLAELFATLLLPEIFFYGLGAMFMAVLNIRHSYGPGAWSPVLNNVVMIVTIAVFWMLPGPHNLNPSTMTTPQILVLGIGTTLGIAAQALVLIPALRGTGFRWKWRFRAHPNEIGRMREVGTLAGWVLGYVVASQIGVTVIAKVGVSHGAFTVFTNADLLLQMPYGILVVSLLTALMPRLSRSAARGETGAVIDDLSLGARLSAVALVPITAGLIVLGPVLNVVLFGYGETSVAGARLIGTSLAISAFGLFPFALVMLQLRVFYAMRDGRTPTLINIFMVATKVIIVLICDATLHGSAHIAEALNTATSASYVVGAIVGHIALTRRLGPLGFSRVARTVARVAVASVLGAVASYGVVVGFEHLLGRGHAGALSGLVFGGVVGLVIMGATAWRMRIPEIQDIVGATRRR